MGKAKLISTLVCSAIIAACSTTNIEQREDIPPSYEHVVVDVRPVERVEPSSPLPLKDNLIQKSIPQPEAPKYSDLWLKIRDQLAFEVPEHQKIEARKSWYLQHPYYMKTVSERAKPFLYHIVQQVEARNLPLELALLPLVESDFKLRRHHPKVQAACGS
jgi:membrane-bound lytic murein transglycosylase D